MTVIRGGAISAFSAHISVRDCDFVNNHAMDSGAINCYELDIANCNFIGNSARYCGAVYGWRINATNCNFSDNTAREWAGALEADYFNATNCNFVNNRAKYGSAIYVGDSILNNCEFRKNFAESYGSAIALRLDHELTVSNCIFKDNVANGGENPFGWPFKNYGNSAIACVGKNFKFNAINCVGLVKNDEKFKEKIYLTVEPSSISMVYKTKKYLLIKFKNTLSHNSFKGLQISINLNGKTIVKTADTNGEVKFLINTVPGSYVAKITFAGDNFRQKATKNVKIVVKKLTPKLIASKKTFNVKVKAKQYKATLKDKNGAAIKNTKLTLKVNGKVYAAKTNAKGQATFKITKLTKKGTYKTIISFAGNKYYNKITKTVYLTVKK